MAWHEGPLLGFDLETTGIDPASDLPVQVALVWTSARRVVRSEAWIVNPARDIPPEATAIHGITSARARGTGRSLAESARRIHSAVRRAALGGIPVVAMNANFDVTIAEALFSAYGLPPLAWRALLDPLVLDRHLDRQREGKRCLEALCEHYGVPLLRPHDAAADAEAAVALTRRIGRRYSECGGLDPLSLTIEQAGWHAEWACERDASCQELGLPGLAEEDFGWPCRRPPDFAVEPISPELERSRRRHPALSYWSFPARSVA
jgi:DNA polymerase III subunit epsilon